MISQAGSTITYKDINFINFANHINLYKLWYVSNIVSKSQTILYTEGVS